MKIWIFDRQIEFDTKKKQNEKKIPWEKLCTVLTVYGLSTEWQITSAQLTQKAHIYKKQN